MTAIGVDRTRAAHVETCMGTVFTIDVRDFGVWDDAIAEVVSWLHRMDGVFSTYRPDSEINRLRSGELSIADADPHVAEVLHLCARLQSDTGGYFTPLWQGVLDPTGLVKGWAIERASELLRAYGSANHAVNGGGDMQLAGEAAAGRPWRVGITDPYDRSRILTVVSGRDFAVATSGAAERGAHIVNPLTGSPACELASVTVVGPALARVDGYATAAFAMGSDARRWLESVPGHEALIVPAAGDTEETSGFRRHVAK